MILTGMTPLIAAISATAIFAALAARQLRQKGRRGKPPQRHSARFDTFQQKSKEQRQLDLLDLQLEAVTRQHVTFSKARVMGRGEYSLFRAALNVTRQSLPSGSYPYYVFPQVSLGQIIRTHAPLNWQSEQAHRAINSKRCDLLIADRGGNPIAVLEYQGAGHNIGGTAAQRDAIKRIAVERAGIRYVEIREATTEAEMHQTIRDLLAQQICDAPDERVSWRDVIAPTGGGGRRNHAGGAREVGQLHVAARPNRPMPNA